MLPAIWSLEGFGLRLGHPRADGLVTGEVQGGVLKGSVLLLGPAPLFALDEP